MATFNEVYAWLSKDVYNEASLIGSSDPDLTAEEKLIYDGLAKADWIRVKGDTENLNIDGLSYNPVTGLYKDDGLQNGFVGAVYGQDTDGNGVADSNFTVVYCGTEFGKQDFYDFIADGTLVAQTKTTQYNDANNLFLAAKAKYSNIKLTGHSIGGGLAQLIAYEQGVTAYTYNAPGMGNVADSSGNSSGITNYVVMNDIVGTLNTDEHLGQTYYLMPEQMNDGSFAPHNKIRYYTSGNKLYSLPNFTEEQAWALWYYDKNNNNTMLKTLIYTQTGDEHLRSAVNILRTLPAPAEILHYSTLQGDIKLGTGGEETLEGTNDILWGGEDTIYGNDGNDTIKGLGGDDTLYGDAGADSIDGGADNDKITVENFHNGDLGIKKLAA